MQFLILADDLTGANDSAAQFAAGGLRTVVAISPFKSEQKQNADVLVLDTESRDIAPERARAAIVQAYDYICSNLDHTVIYKKVDSTLRGQVGAELEALAECCRPRLVIFAPAFPQAGRTTEQGYQLLHGVRLEHTELASIPKSPVTTSFIPDILRKGTQLEPVLLNLQTLRGGKAQLQAFLTSLAAQNADKAEQGKTKVVVADIQTTEELDLLVHACAGMDKVLYAGSAGLAQALGAQLPAASVRKAEHRAERLLYLSGSISKVSQAQCRYLQQHAECQVFSLSPAGVLSDCAQEAARIVSAVRTQAGTASCVLISGALSGSDVDACRQEAQVRQLSFFECGELYARTMGLIMAELGADFDAYVMTGGDTAVHACRAAGATAFAVDGEIEKGIPLCTIASGSLSGRTLVSKAGAFGQENSFFNIYTALTATREGKMRKPVLGITMGDPAGIGSEITVKSLLKPELYEKCVPVVFGDAAQLRRALAIIGQQDKVQVHVINHPSEAQSSPERIEVIDLHNVPEDVPFGQVNAVCGKAAYEYIAKAVEYTKDFSIHAVVTAPLNKEALHAGGCPFPGHTEILANLTHTLDYSMMLVGPKLRVIHVSTHIALRKACDACTKERVLKVIELADDTLKLMGIENRRIAVAGLNPHCGEGGLFGDEEIKNINPAVQAAKDEGINVFGPIAPDTVFHRAANKGEFDIVVVMYHDQGHIPLKVLGFSSGVNVTVGLPCIRTSVDHGTAFEIAGKGIADCLSMDTALDLAAVMANTRFKDKLQ